MKDQGGVQEVSNVTSGSSICPFSLVLQMMLLETFTIEIRKDFCKFLVSNLMESLGLVLKGWIWAQGRMACSLISETRPWYFRMATLDSGRLATGTLVIQNSGTEQKQSVFALGQHGAVRGLRQGLFLPRQFLGLHQPLGNDLT